MFKIIRAARHHRGLVCDHADQDTRSRASGHRWHPPQSSINSELARRSRPGHAATEEARRRDPKAQLFPEISVSIMGHDHLRAGEPKLAVEILKLVLLAYPDSADAHDNLADVYLADGQKDLARQNAEKALALLDSHTAPASSWSDTEERRKLIRDSAQQNLKQLGAAR